MLPTTISEILIIVTDFDSDEARSIKRIADGRGKQAIIIREQFCPVTVIVLSMSHSIGLHGEDFRMFLPKRVRITISLFG